MEDAIFQFITIGIAITIAITQVIVLLLMNLQNKKRDKEEKVEGMEQKSWEVLHDAQLKANKILNNAELKGIEFISKQKLDVAKIQDEYIKSIKDLQINLTNTFTQSMDRADKSYQGFLGILQENLRHQELKNQQIFEEKTNKVIESAQSTMTKFIVDVNSKVSRQIDEQLKVIGNELELYKNHRMKIIDKYISDILQRTIEETLGKKLTLDEHTDLIFQALEKAKSEQKLK